MKPVTSHVITAGFLLLIGLQSVLVWAVVSTVYVPEMRTSGRVLAPAVSATDPAATIATPTRSMLFRVISPSFVARSPTRSMSASDNADRPFPGSDSAPTEEWMDFGILGPLEVSDDGGVLSLRGTKQRALLALLLLHANEVVSTDRLMDQLWGDDPPDSGTAALQVRVSKLREALGAGGETIVTPGSSSASDRIGSRPAPVGSSGCWPRPNAISAAGDAAQGLSKLGDCDLSARAGRRWLNFL